MPADSSLSRTPWRHLPNAISIARLAAAPVLLAAVLQAHRPLFQWLLLACLLSDILDGLIARLFHLTSRLGAALDSAADVATMLLGLTGVWRFQQSFALAHLVPILAVAALYLVEIAAALLRYGRLSSFHTLASRIAAYAGGIFVISLFLWGYQGWIFWFAIAAYLLSLVEELILVALLPAWRSDVGGLHRVLRRPAPESSSATPRAAAE